MSPIFNFTFNDVVGTLPLVLIIMILVMALAIMLRSLTFTVVQFMFMVAMYMLNFTFHPALMFVSVGIQFVLVIYLIYKYVSALERNYQLILEKTHQAPASYTKRGQGEQKSFM